MESKFDKIYEQVLNEHSMITEQSIIIAEGKLKDLIKTVGTKIKSILSGNDKKIADGIAAQIIINKLKQVKPTTKNKAAINQIVDTMADTVPDLIKKIDGDQQLLSNASEKLQHSSQFKDADQFIDKQLQQVIWELDPTSNTFMRKNWSVT